MTELAFADSWYWFLIAALVSYLIGCINFAVIISSRKNSDIRRFGSGNPGTMNMTRTFGLKVGIVNFFFDIVKGGLPTLIGWIIFKDYVFAGTNIVVADFVRCLIGFCVIAGHVFPVTLQFHGGKGIASTRGGLEFSLACDKWWYFLIVVVFLFAVLGYIALTEWGSMGSLIGVAGLTIWQAIVFILKYDGELLNGYVISMFMMLLGINLFTWIRHNINIYKLLAGEEHHTAVIKHKNKLKG